MDETSKKALIFGWRLLLFKLEMYRKWDSNPHDFKGHWILSPARLPVPPFRYSERMAKVKRFLKLKEEVLSFKF